MGAPKQKWTEEEEAALRAGVLKHGTGKWRTILSDPEFTGTLHSRSNVDLKVRNLTHTELANCYWTDNTPGIIFLRLSADQ